MISLRYHIVSLVAVFLALGVGLVMGATVIDKGVASGLEAQFNRANNRANTLERDKVVLQRELSLWEGFGRALAPSLVRDRLAGRTVTLLVQEGADGDLIGDVRQGLTAAGATVHGRLRLSSKWALEGEPAREQLATVVGVAAGDGRLMTEAATLLARRLEGAADPRREGDLFAALSAAGFVAVEDAPNGEAFPPSGALFVLVPAGDSDVRVPPGDFMLVLLRALSTARPVAVAEGVGAERFLADAVRGDGAAARTVATVDHADTAPGQIALAHVLAALAAGRPAEHYGIRGGVVGVVPAATPT